jgi:hypothetical protein
MFTIPIGFFKQGPVIFQDGFEFSDGWDETVASIPTPSFTVVSYNEAFEFSDGWNETVDGVPSPSFSTASYDENFDGYWNGT